MQKHFQPGDVIGYVNGKPVPAVAGGSTPAGDPVAPPAPPAQPVMVNSADGSVLTGVDPRTTPQSTFTIVNPSTTGANPATVFTPEDIAKARQQEKDKLYPQLEELKKTVGELQKERDKQIAAEKKAREEAEAALEAKRQEELTLAQKIEEQRAEFDAKLAALQTEREQERQVSQMERAFQELQTYKAQALGAAADDIIPQLAEELNATQHTSREEIDQHIARLKATSQSIIENMQAAMQQQRAGMRGTPVTAPPAGPLDTYSASDPALEAAANGTLTFEDYVKNRDKLLPAATRGGIYG